MLLLRFCSCWHRMPNDIRITYRKTRCAVHPSLSSMRCFEIYAEADQIRFRDIGLGIWVCTERIMDEGSNKHHMGKCKFLKWRLCSSRVPINHHKMHNKSSLASLAMFTCQKDHPPPQPRDHISRPEQPEPSTSTSTSPDSAALISIEQRNEQRRRAACGPQTSPRASPVLEDPRASAPRQTCQTGNGLSWQGTITSPAGMGQGGSSVWSQRQEKCRGKGARNRFMAQRHSRAPFPAPLPSTVRVRGPAHLPGGRTLT